MIAGPWSRERLRGLSSSVLVRSASRLREALRHLEPARSPSVDRIHQDLRAVEGEIERRGLTADAFFRAEGEADGTNRDREGSKPEMPVGGVSDTGGGSNTEGRGTVDATASPERGPLFRFIPQLKGTPSKVISVLSEEGVVRYQSEPIQWLLGFDAEVLVGQPLEEFVCHRSQALLEEGVARMRRREEKFDSWRLQFLTASGEALWLEGMVSNFLYDPRLEGILVYWRELVGTA